MSVIPPPSDAEIEFEEWQYRADQSKPSKINPTFPPAFPTNIQIRNVPPQEITQIGDPSRRFTESRILVFDGDDNELDAADYEGTTEFNNGDRTVTLKSDGKEWSLVVV